MMIATLEKRAIKTRKKLEEHLDAVFPVGCRFFVRINSRQRKGTPATVIGAKYATGLGMIRFRLETKKNRVIDVHYSDVYSFR